MSIFDDVLQADSEFFVDADIIGGEQVVYVPRTGSPRVIQAIVSRNQLSPISELPGNSRPVVNIVISVQNNAVCGIASTEIDTGGDRVRLSRRKGAPVEDRPIANVISHDAGMLRLEVR